jgi:hypothetical protein
MGSKKLGKLENGCGIVIDVRRLREGCLVTKLTYIRIRAIVA